MRADYLSQIAPIRLPVTKKAKLRLEKIQEQYLPGFNLASVVKILAGVYCQRHSLSQINGPSDVGVPEASAKQDYVELLSCTTAELVILLTVIEQLRASRPRARSTALITELVDDFARR